MGSIGTDYAKEFYFVITNEILLRFKKSSTIDDIDRITKKYNLVHVSDITDELAVYYIDSKDYQQNIKIVKILVQESIVENAANNISQFGSIQYSTDDTFFKSNGGGREQGLWWTYSIFLNDAWDFTKGSQNTIIAIIDTGIDKNHEHLSSNISCVGLHALPTGTHKANFFVYGVGFQQTTSYAKRLRGQPRFCVKIVPFPREALERV